MNNREYLIQILLKLRSTGIKNDGVLKAIEKLPPHYYLSLFKEEKVSIDINIKELIEITKIIETILIHNNKSENILLYGFHSGWSLVLLKNFCKRIYGISRSKKQKKKIEDLLFRKSYNNIFLNTGTDILCWKKVAPFDIILSYDINSFILNEVLEYLSPKGIAIIPMLNKQNNIEICCINKKKLSFRCHFNYELLSKSYLI